MSKAKLSDLSTAELERRLKAIRVLQWAVMGIFGLILLVWIALGYWKEYLPGFAMTIVLAAGGILGVSVPAMGVSAELRRRREAKGARSH
ncbi:MAG: hypothetical protein JJT96_10370 [Opitutales bacterium]|nr:hypothetical protein [Opitutales bacterium]